MKYISQFNFLFFVVALSWITSSYAQPSSMDANRLNRDINIMENILDEIFKMQSASHVGAYVIGRGDLFRIRNGIRGTYLSGYGVIFTVPSTSHPFIMTLGDDDHSRAYSYSFAYTSDEETDNKVDEESVINRIEEFLRDYGSTIGQLSSDEKVMVIYGANRAGTDVTFFNVQDDSQTIEKIPTISVAVTKSDLDAYRSGKINASELENRFSVAKTADSDKRQLDMEVMGNIFETAFKHADEKGFRIRGSVDHLKLDNFGALFFFDASYSDSDMFRAPPLPPAPRIEILRDSQRRSSVNIARKLMEQTEEEVTKREQKEAALKEEVKKAYSSFKTQLKEYMVDYGRTLSSIKSDQYVMASITLSTGIEDIPERVDVQIKKSVLEAVDKGSMSRDKALSQVVIREY